MVDTNIFPDTYTIHRRIHITSSPNIFNATGGMVSSNIIYLSNGIYTFNFTAISVHDSKLRFHLDPMVIGTNKFIIVYDFLRSLFLILYSQIYKKKISIDLFYSFKNLNRKKKTAEF